MDERRSLAGVIERHFAASRKSQRTTMAALCSARRQRQPQDSNTECGTKSEGRSVRSFVLISWPQLQRSKAPSASMSAHSRKPQRGHVT